MLQEVKKTRQVKGDLPRRWFADETMDLIVWFDRKFQIVGFQLCYDKPRAEHALTWQAGSGFQHNRVDDGEGRPGSHKGTPILVADGKFDLRDIAEKFRSAAKDIDKEIAGFVYRKLLS